MKKKTPAQKAANKKTIGKKTAKKSAPKRLISASEPKAVSVRNPKSLIPVVIACDHASRRIPKSLGTLGLSAKSRKENLAWDHGTKDIGLYLSKKLGATAVIAGYSRIVIDLNRGLDSPDLIRAMAVSGPTPVPGNKDVSAAARRQRIKEIHTPYHDTVAKQVDRFLKRGVPPLFLAIHSLTPVMNGVRRPWHLCLMWNKEEKLAKKFIANVKKQNPGMKIGENVPYSLKGGAGSIGWNTISHHAESQGLPYIAVEFRQDLVDTKAKAEKWAKIFLKALVPLLDDPDTFRRRK